MSEQSNCSDSNSHSQQQITSKSHSPFPLYHDTMIVVAQFLNLHELHTLVQLSPRFHRVVQTMKPLPLMAMKFELYRVSVTSAVARHVGELFHLWTQVLIDNRSSQLSDIVEQFPNLCTMNMFSENYISPRNYSLPHHPLKLQQTLRKISIQIEFDNCHILMPALAELPLVQELHLVIEDRRRFNSMPDEDDDSSEDEDPIVTYHDVSFAALTRGKTWPLLQDFRLSLHTSTGSPAAWRDYLASPNPLPNSLVHFLRDCSNLQKLMIHYGSKFLNNSLRQLMDSATTGATIPLLQSGNLTALELDHANLDLSLLESLSKISSLTEIALEQPINIEAKDMQLLTHLPRLTSLRVLVSEPYPPQVLVVAAQSAQHLKHLIFFHRELTTEQLDIMLAHLPSLTELCLIGCLALTSLAPLSQHKLPERLKILEVHGALHIPIADITSYIFLLQQLEVLRIEECFSEQVPSELKEQLVFGSPRFPNLKNEDKRT